MARNVGSVNISVNYVVNQNTMQQVNRSIGRLQSQAPRIQNSFTSAFGKIGAACAAAFSVKALVDFSKKALDLASDLQEVQNVVHVTFGEMEKTVNKFAKGAIMSIGMSETKAKKYAGVFGSMAKSFGFTDKEAANMAMSITRLTGDVSSFYNLDHELSYLKLKAIFTGETEGLKDLGVVMTQVSLDQYALQNGFGKTLKEMTEQEKVMLRYQFVMDKLSLASGDFERTQDGWANQTRIVSEKVKAIIASIGDGLIILLTPAIQQLNTFLDYVQKAADKFAGFVALLTGKKVEAEDTAKAEAKAAAQIGAIASSASEGENSLGGLSSGLEKAGKAAKAAKESMASFDNVVQLADTSGGSSGGAGGGAGSGSGSAIPEYKFVDDKQLQDSETLLEKFSKKVKGLFDFTDLKSNTDLFDFTNLKNDIKSIKKSLSTIFDNITPSSTNLLQSLGGTLQTVGISTLEIAKGVVEGIVGGIEHWLSEGEERISEQWSTIENNWAESLNNIGTYAEDMGDILGDFFSFESTQQAIGNCLTSVEGLVTGSQLLMSDLYLSASEFVSQTVEDNYKGLYDFFGNFSVILEEITGVISTVITDCFKSIHSLYLQYLRPTFKNLQEAFSKVAGSFLKVWNESIFPLIEIVIQSVQNLWSNHLKPFVDEVLGMAGAFIEMVSVIYNEVLAPIVSAVVEFLVPYISAALSVMWGVIETLVEQTADIFRGLVQTLRGIFEIISGIFTGDWQKICDGFMNILDGLIRTLAGMFSKVVNVIIGGLNGLIRAANNIKIPGTEIGVNIPEIPKFQPKILMADGGIVYRPTDFGNFIAGEAGAEAIVPLENSSYTQTLAKEIVKGLADAGYGGTTFNIENAFGDERAMERLVTKISEVQKRQGLRKGVLAYG